MSEGITESLVHNIMDTISDNVSKHKNVSFFEDEDSSSVSNKLNRLFGREKPVHHILGGGKCADALLWRNKKISASVLGSATIVSSSSAPRIVLPEEVFVNVGKLIGTEVNRGFGYMQDVACEGTMKQFLVVGSLFAAAIIGSWCNFLTVLYLGFVAAHTFPIVYEKYEDQIDNFVFNVLGQVQHNYKKLDISILSRIPKAGSFRYRAKKAD